MRTIYNELHSLHHGKVEMFRGELVPCFEVPARADYVLRELQERNLGPEGGNGGGQVVAAAPPQELVNIGTHTGQALRPVLNR